MLKLAILFCPEEVTPRYSSHSESPSTKVEPEEGPEWTAVFI